MKPVSGKSAIGLAATFASLASAAVATYSTGESKDISFRWGVPESSASSGQGDIYFQFDASEEYAWVGLGIGQRMAGSQMFIIYQDGEGNVTLSTRQGKGHVMPQYTERTDVELLAGSGLVNGKMVANVKCSACDGLDLGGSNGWIAGWKKGGSLDTTNVEANINEHDEEDEFQVNFAQARISTDANPFLGNSVDNPPTPAPGQSGGDSDESESGGVSGSVLVAHGITMAIAFVIMYPLGSALMPLIGKWYLHAASQGVAYLLMWVGFATGYVYAEYEGYFFNQAHTRLGVFVVALLGIQPVLGWLHHLYYRKHQRRGIMGHVHIWYGRILIILGIINGGLGLQLAGSSRTWVIIYSVLAGVFSALYIGSIVTGHVKKRNRVKEIGTPLSETRTSA